ncbi:MAG: hypothetical protein WBG23_04780 [Acidobacteriaceae bacterium]
MITGELPQIERGDAERTSSPPWLDKSAGLGETLSAADTLSLRWNQFSRL